MDQPLSRPRQRIENLVITEFDGETLVYDLERHLAHSLNRTASVIWQHCDGRTAVPALADLLPVELGLPASEELVGLALQQLGKANLLAGEIAPETRTYSRREVLRTLGRAGVLLLPLVASVAIPSPAFATSVCGSTCVTSSTCTNPACGTCRNSTNCAGKCCCVAGNPSNPC